MPDVQNMLDLAKQLGGIVMLVFYASIVLWTYKDARRRIDDPILVATAVAASMLPIVGVLVYMLLRPPEYLADVRERELEIRAMERTLGRQERCPYCRSHIEGEYLSCPVCMSKLREQCVTCDKPLDPRWAMCPFCETEVAARQGGRDVPGGRPRPSLAESRSTAGSGSGRSSSSPRRAGKPTKASAPVKPSETKSSRRGSSSNDSDSSSKPRRSSTSPSDSSHRPRREEKTRTDIDTEPFAAGNMRFVRSEQTAPTPQVRSTSDAPTMIHTGPTTTSEQ